MAHRTIMRRTIKVNLAFARMVTEFFRENLLGRQIPPTWRKKLENDFKELTHKRDRLRHRATKLDMKDWAAQGE